MVGRRNTGSERGTRLRALDEQTHLRQGYGGQALVPPKGNTFYKEKGSGVRINNRTH
jgi:hypothetical protein